MDDDYGSYFDSFNFSDGESFSAYSDASNVDYGFATPDIFGQLNPDTLDPSALADNFSLEGIDFGATPEPSTFFGTIAGDGTFTAGDAVGILSKGIPVAVKGAAGASSTSLPAGAGNKSGQSSTATKGTAKPVTQAGSAPATNTAIGLLGQVESMLGITNNGQLKPNTGVSAAPNATTGGTNTYLMIGLALIAFAVIVKAA